MPKYKRVLLKLSGEALKNASDKGIIDFDFTAKVAEQIKRCTDEGVSFGLVIGGGIMQGTVLALLVANSSI